MHVDMFLCAQTYPYIASEAAKDISYRSVRRTPLAALSEAELEEMYGVETYKSRYAPALRSQRAIDEYNAELQRWTCTFHNHDFCTPVNLMCCPEDIRCASCSRDGPPHKLCLDCNIPMCRVCHKAVEAGRIPAAALANGMWIGEPHPEYYTDMSIQDVSGHITVYQGGITVMEMICASVCYTSMICFSMEYRFGSMHGTEVNMNRHRVGARGNVTCFPLPWEQLLEQFEEVAQHRARVPRTGDELADLVRVLLKTSATEDSDHTSWLKSCIYQARIRRAVVVKLILDAKARGHPAYGAVDEKQVRERAAALPIDAVPPQLFAILGNDNSIDKLRPQKAATPVEGRSSAEHAFSCVRPHAVVQERSCADVADINEQRLSTLHETVSAVTGNIPSEEPRHDVSQWTTANVVEWACARLIPAACNAFREHDIDGRKLINLDVKALLSLGIGAEDHEAVLGHIKKLCSSGMIPNYVVRTGNVLIDQFKPSFFATAFPFVFKYGTGMPDIGKDDDAVVDGARRSHLAVDASVEATREPYPGMELAGPAQEPHPSVELANDAHPRGSGRPRDAPRVNLKPWCKAITRRVESHCGRYWLLGFAMWNLCFRTTVNQTKSFQLSNKSLAGLTADDAEQ